jgi:hypothetical protein
VKLTKNRGYPYPLRTERGAGGLDIERLARSVDRDLKNLDTAWQVDMVQPSFTQTGSDTGIPDSVDWGVNTSATEYSVGSPNVDIPAYWLIDVNMGLTASAGITANSRRTLKVQIEESQTGGLQLVEEYQAQDFQADATVWLSTSFVTLFNKPRFISYNVNHGNVASTLNATLRVSWTQLLLA